MSILTSIENILAAASNITSTQLGTDGQKVVTDAVNAAEALGGTGTVKFSAALSQAGSDLFALGKDVSLFTLHLAIEAAVTSLNAPAITAAVQAVETPSTATASPAPSAAPVAAAPVVPQAAVAAPAITGQALSNAIANVIAGSTVAVEGATLATELQGQGQTVTLDQAEAAITQGLPQPEPLTPAPAAEGSTALASADGNTGAP